MDPAVTGALVGGGIAVATTVANLGYNWLQSRGERRFALRQQVYLDACVWAASGSEYLAGFARLDLDDAQLVGILQSSMAAYYRVHVVASQETVLAFAAASEFLGTQSLELMATRVELRGRGARLETLQTDAAQTAAYLAQASSIVESIPRAEPSPELLARIPAIVSEFMAARDRQQKVQSEIDYVRVEIDTLQEQLLDLCKRATIGYGRCLVSANISARKELGLALDERGYRQHLESASARVLGGLDRVVTRLKGER